MSSATGLRLLLVEDHLDSAELLADLLARRGHTVVIAGCAREALERATTEPFDLVVSDVGLPDGSGYDLMKALRAARPIRGIAMSGYGRAEDLAASREAGFEEHLTKPILLAKLEQAIARIQAPGATG